VKTQHGASPYSLLKGDRQPGNFGFTVSVSHFSISHWFRRVSFTLSWGYLQISYPLQIIEGQWPS